MFDFSQPIWINWELNNICNLMCPQCGRNEIKNGILQWRKEPAGSPTKTLNDVDNSLETFKKVFKNIGYPVDLIRFQGHVSENVASKEFIPICEYIISEGTNITISTNGSLRTEEFWYNLGKVFNKKSKINFSIDGMGDALGVYRVNASYEKVIQNASAFMRGGGRACWRMIIFKHNQHQIEDARKEAERLGFEDFSIVHTDRRYFMDQEYSYKGQKYVLENQDIAPRWNEKVDDNLQWDGWTEISCKAQNENQFYVDCKNKPWACYYIPNKGGLSREKEWYKEYAEDESLTLENKTLDDILNHKFYHAIQMSWGSKSSCLSTCRKKCSVGKGLVRSWELNSGKIYKDRRGGAIQSWYEDNSS